jgi:Arc/MetJ family transcription regulator
MRYAVLVRTTIDLDDDVLQAISKVRNDRKVSLSAAVNDMIRAGLRLPTADYVYTPQSRDMGALVDLSNVADVLELLDEADRLQSAPHAS